MSRAPAKPYMDPYLAGIGLGLVLLLAFAVAGRGLGASGAFAVAATEAAGLAQRDTGFFRLGSAEGGIGVSTWILLEVLGVLAGGYVSARLAGRVSTRFERGGGLSVSARTFHALAGGFLMAVGSVLARGCTSGQGLTGGALLNLGSWVFLVALFIGSYLTYWTVGGFWE